MRKLAWLCALSMGTVSAQAAGINFNSGVKPVTEIVKEVGPLVGKTLKVSTQLSGEIMLINVTDVDAQALLDKIAAVTYGRWSEVEKDVLQLLPDSTLRQKVAREAAAKRAADAKKVLDELDPNKAGGGAVGGGGRIRIAMTMNGNAANPGDKAIKKVLKMMDPASIANVAMGTRTVFSSRPTQMQGRLPGGASAVLGSLVAEYNAWATEENKKQMDTGGDMPDNEQTRMIREMMQASRPKIINEPAQQATLALERGMFSSWMGGGWPSATLKLYDARGRVLLEASTNLKETDFAALMPGATPPAEKPNEPKPKNIEFSKISDEFQALNGRMMGGGFGIPAKMSDELLAKMLRPDLHDPLSYVYGEGINWIAKDRNWDVVANLSDQVEGFSFGGMNGAEMTDVQLLKSFKSESVTSEIKDGWFEIKPTQPDEAVANRLNRVALAKLIKASREKWVPSLDDVADYARYNPDPIQGGISMRYLRLAPNAMSQGFMGQGSWDVLKFYGSLNAAQRQGLKSSGTLQFGALSGESSAILARIMFGADVNLITEREAARNESMMDNMRNMMRNMTGGQQNENFLDEPTFVMPTGLPRNGFVALKINSETTLMPATPESKPDMSFGAIGLEETAFMKYMQQDQNMARFATGIPTYDLVYQGQRGVYDMRFYVSPNILAKYTLHDNKMDTNAKATAFTSLPQPVQDKVSKIVEDIKKGGMPFQMMGGTGRIRT